MQFDECQEGDYRIFVGAVEAPKGDGYIAAMVVNRVRGLQAASASRPREAYRDDSVACGYRWPSADQAIHYALGRARDMIRSRSQMLAC